MALTNPFSITYGAMQIGGDSHTYLLHGPYVIDKSYASVRVVFDAIVVATSYETLESLSSELEDAFRARDQNLVIDLAGSEVSLLSGASILNAVATCQKSGNPETDRGYSRAYTVTVSGELPAEDNGGLRELEMNVEFASGRQKTVSFRGSYTAIAGQTSAAAQYAGDFDARATTALTGVDNAAVWELVHENYTADRNGFTLAFQRQYTELLVNQSDLVVDDPEIRDHRVVFTDRSQHPGDGQENVHRLRHAIGSYDCAIDIDETTDMQTVYTEKVRAHVLGLFDLNFSPVVFAIEEERVSYDETQKRMSVSIGLIYQKQGGDEVVEVSQSVTIRESRNIDYTPMHNRNEFSAYADPGWAIKERINTRTSIVLGSETPKSRISGKPSSGPAGLMSGGDGPDSSGGGLAGGAAALGGVNRTGWNTIQSTSQSTPQWIGDPSLGTQMLVTTLSEVVIERWNEAP